jgi:pimeloyl-ACP methyl ester carboxylesterase
VIWTAERELVSGKPASVARMPYVDASGVSVHYVEHGPRDAERILVLLHGFTPDHRLMTGAFEPVLARRVGWRRVYLDLPGMGLTKAPGHDEMAVVQTEGTYRRVQREIAAGIAVADLPALDRIQGGWGGTFPREPEDAVHDAPVLIFTGRQDSSTGFRDAWPLLGHYPHATFAVLDRAGHNGHIEQAAVFDTLVEEWLDRVEGRKG